MATSTTTTTKATGFELDQISQTLTSTQTNRIATTNNRTQADSTDTILQASLIADSSVPDGGKGWRVVFGCAVLSWWAVGTSYCWGVFQNALVAEGVSSPATLSFVGSSAIACIAVFAILNSKFSRRLGARYTSIIGVSLMGCSELLSGFSTRSVGGMFVTAGVMMGLGISLCFTVMSTMPAQYFSRKRGLANGLVFAGGGLGGAIISLGIDGLIEKLGPAWTYRVIGLITLATGLPAAWLIEERVPIKVASAIEWRLFKDFQFAVLFLAGAVGTFPLLVPPFFLPLYIHSLGMSSSTGAGLVAGFNFASAIGRILSGFLSDRLGSLNTLFLAFTLNALSMLVLWPVSTNLIPLVIFCIICGAANGSFFATMPTVVGNLFGSARLSVAMSMIVTGWGGGYLMGAPIAGYLLQAYGGEEKGFEAFRPAILYAGSVALGAASMILLIRLKSSTKILAKGRSWMLCDESVMDNWNSNDYSDAA